MAAMSSYASGNVPLSENLGEDFNMDSNPSAFFKEEDESLPKTFQVVGTQFSPEFVSYIDGTNHYMGNISMVYSTFEDKNRVRIFGEILEEKSPPVAVSNEQMQSINIQSFQPQTRGLLHLPEYIKARIVGISTFVSFGKKYGDRLRDPKDIGKELEVLGMKDSEKDIVKENIRRFVINNSMTLYSSDQSVKIHIFCPIISYHNTDRESYWTLKFLQISKREFLNKDDIDYTIMPAIYSVYLKITNGMFNIPILTPRGNSVNLLYKTNARLRSGIPFPLSISFYNPVTATRKTLVLQKSNPVDCVTVSMHLCGLLDQPDLMRYHNIFRNVTIEHGANELRTTLSPGTVTFVRDLVGSKIISFLNRDNLRDPLKKLMNIRIFVHGSEDVIGNNKMSIKKTINGVDLYATRSCYYVRGYKDGDTLAQNNDFFKETLHRLGFNRPNVFYTTVIYGHQFTISYDPVKDTYVGRDYQINETYTRFTNPSIIEHANFTGQDRCYFTFYGVETSLPSQECSLVVPEMPLLYDWHRDPKIYTGNPFPLVRSYINDFIKQYKATGKIPIYPRVVRPSDIYDLNLKTTALIRDLGFELEQEKLSLVRHLNPAISFNLYPQLISVLDNAIEVMQNPRSGVGRFIKKFSAERGDEIIQLYTSKFSMFNLYPKYEKPDVYNLLLSRPLFCAMIMNARDNQQPFLERIAQYLYENTKPTLDIFRIFEEEILPLSITDGIGLQMIRYLSSLKSYTLAVLVDIAIQISADLDERKFTFYEQIFYEGGKKYVKELSFSIYKVLSRNVLDLERNEEKLVMDRAMAKVVSQLSSQKTLLPGGKPLTMPQIKKFFEQNRDYLREAEEAYNVREEFKPPTRVLGLIDPEDEPLDIVRRSIDLNQLTKEQVDDIVLQLIQGRECSPLLLPEMTAEDVIKKRIDMVEDKGKVCLSRLKSRVKQQRLERYKKVPEIEREELDDMIQILIDQMQDAERDKLNRVPYTEWSPVDRMVLLKEIEKQMGRVRLFVDRPELKDDAFDTFSSLMTILKNITRVLDRNFLGIR